MGVVDISGQTGLREFLKRPNPYKIYGVSIDLSNSNPETSVTYTDDAVGMIGGSSDWDTMPIFKDIKPCLLKSGVVSRYMLPNNFSVDASGSNIDNSVKVNGDLMIEFPKTGYSININNDILTVKITDNPSNPNFSYNAFTRDIEGDREKLYIGGYLGSIADGKLSSLRGKTPASAGETATTFRTLAQANGAGYDMVSIYPLIFLQCLYLIRYKNLDSQTALGRGYVDGNSAVIATGGTATKGMYFGETTGKLQMKFAGIEDFWGNRQWFIEGMYTKSNRIFYTAFTNFNVNLTGYMDQGKINEANTTGFMTRPKGNNQAGFIMESAGGSSTTYFCDNMVVGTQSGGYSIPSYGGSYSIGSNAGVFTVNTNTWFNSTLTGCSARLMYL